ncbi:MAG TPA: UvrD-helicase domain-containing protein [Patescibacteria group bacterium]|nr:UvrD-helicase domain-containing protein [Patescibacteria group bacterium]
MAKTIVLKNQAPVKELKVNYSKDLNQEQYQVVTGAEGPCLVLAGAGSGKTRTIVYRVAYLIERSVKAENILLVTFTNKAAKEMLKRVEALLGRPPERLWGGTFHHIGNRILRKYAAKLGYNSNFSILDEEDAKDLIKVCLKESDINLKDRRFPSPAVIKDLLSYAKNSQRRLLEVIEQKHPKWSALAEQLSQIGLKYEEKKRRNNSMDFDDLLVNWLRLLKKEPAVKDRLSAQFHYILVDEYQDTNYIQAAIIKELSSVHHNVLVVGDDAQSIYSFRAADIGNILNFPEIFPRARIFKLESNYRSTPEILKVANSVIVNNKKQYPKTLKPVVGGFIKPNLVPAVSARQEAQFISGQILQLRDEGLPLNKIAVLFRAAYHSQELEFELTKRDIPYDYRGGVRFFERSHIKDALAYLKIINNPQDEVAWHRVLSRQAGIGEVTAGKIYQKVGQLEIKEIIGQDLSEVLSVKADVGWRALIKTIKDLEIERPEDLRPEKAIGQIAKSDYRDYLEAEYPNWQERLEDLNQLALFAERYPDLNSFLAEVSLQEAFGVERGRPDAGAGEKIILSTIHQAKGLEWEAIFVINLVDAAFPNQRALAEPDGEEEERRLFYVAVTRARKQLFLSYPLTGSYSAMALNTPSRFLNEIDVNLLETVKLIEAGEDYSDLNDGGVNYLPDLGSL